MIYPSVNGLKTIREITRGNLTRPNMSVDTWDEDFTSHMNRRRYDEYDEDDD